MRIATLHTAQTAFDAIAARQSEQARLQTQLTTGLRVNSPGDDPVAAAQAELARSRLARSAQDQRTAQLATGLLSAADGALSEGIGALQSVRERLVAAGNASYNASDRQALALELRSARDQLLTLANSRDGAGGFIFSGQGSPNAPMVAGSVPAFSAAAGEQRIGAEGRFAATVDGRSTFMALPQGNGAFVTASGGSNAGTGWIDPGSVSNPALLTGHNYQITVAGAPGSLTYSVTNLTTTTTLVSGVPYVAGSAIELDGQRVQVAGTPVAGDTFQVGPSGQQSIFTTLDQAIAALEMPVSGPAYSERLMRAQASLDRALDGMSMMRSRVGDELRNVDSAFAASQMEELSATQRLSNLQDLDFAKGISALQANQTALEAGLKSYASIARTSLFQLLG